MNERKVETEHEGEEVDITPSEAGEPDDERTGDPGRTPGKAEGADDN